MHAIALCSSLVLCVDVGVERVVRAIALRAVLMLRADLHSASRLGQLQPTLLKHTRGDSFCTCFDLLAVLQPCTLFFSVCTRPTAGLQGGCEFEGNVREF